MPVNFGYNPSYVPRPPQGAYGMPQQQFAPPSYGFPQPQYAAAPPNFGYPPQAFAQPQPLYAQPSYGFPQQQFAQPPQGFGYPQQAFVRPQQPVFLGPPIPQITPDQFLLTQQLQQVQSQLMNQLLFGANGSGSLADILSNLNLGSDPGLADWGLTGTDNSDGSQGSISDMLSGLQAQQTKGDKYFGIGGNLGSTGWDSLQKRSEYQDKLMKSVIKIPTLVDQHLKPTSIINVMAGQVLQEAVYGPDGGEAFVAKYTELKEADLADDNELNGSTAADAPALLRGGVKEIQKAFYKLDLADDGEANSSFVDTIQAEILSRQFDVRVQAQAESDPLANPFQFGTHGLDASAIHVRELSRFLEGPTELSKGTLVDGIDVAQAELEKLAALKDKLSAEVYQHYEDYHTRDIQIQTFLLDNFDKLAGADGNKRTLGLEDLLKVVTKAIDNNPDLANAAESDRFVTLEMLNSVQ